MQSNKKNGHDRIPFTHSSAPLTSPDPAPLVHALLVHSPTEVSWVPTISWRPHRAPSPVSLPDCQIASLHIPPTRPDSTNWPEVDDRPTLHPSFPKKMIDDRLSCPGGLPSSWKPGFWQPGPTITRPSGRQVRYILVTCSGGLLCGANLKQLKHPLPHCTLRQSGSKTHLLERATSKASQIRYCVRRNSVYT